MSEKNKRVSFEPAKTNELIQRYKAGDRAGLEELYRRYAIRVLGLVRAKMGNMLRSLEGSADLAQEALLKSLRGLESLQFESDGDFIGYLARKTEEVIVDRARYWHAQRRDPSRAHYLGQEKVEQPASQVQDPLAVSAGELLARREDTEHLLEALNRLQLQFPEHHALLIAAKIEGRSYEELTAIRGKSPDAIRMEVKRAMEKLAKISREMRSPCHSNSLS